MEEDEEGPPARYCALRVVTRMACLRRALSGMLSGRKLSMASNERDVPFLLLV